eukprot:TRINITY_DN10340_c0_g2_i2.p2 TRINITY_DN10340_c0_g2~~TRINITY_DN10340_c0_g2_i2.p2  ORF type:complete len:114 (-),score=20.63 TRINITY_DN10340_c0_g2_i2:579-920(-)
MLRKASGKIRGDLEKRIMSLMVQYVADAPADKRQRECFIQWIRALDSKLIKQVVNLFGRKELNELWKRKDNSEIIAIAKNEIKKEIELSFDFLVIPLAKHRNPYHSQSFSQMP